MKMRKQIKSSETFPLLPMTTCYRGIFLEVTLFKNATFSRFRLFYMQRIKLAVAACETFAMLQNGYNTVKRVYKGGQACYNRFDSIVRKYTISSKKG